MKILLNNITSWLIVPLASIFGSLIGVLFSIPVCLLARKLGIRIEGYHHFEELPLIVAIIAFFIVISASFAAPKYKILVAIITFILGDLIAWNLTVLRSDAIQLRILDEQSARTLTPFIIISIGGFIGVVASIVYSNCFAKTSKCMKDDMGPG